jgi:hypothetical protein
MVDAAAGAVPVAWSLITAPDERKLCCVVTDAVRCDRATEFEVRGAGGELDDYTFTCAGHLELVRRPGDLVTRVDEPPTETDALEPAM